MTSMLHRLRPKSEDGFDRRLIAPMILGSILNPVNSSIIAVSLVPIGVALGAPPSQTAWLVSSLYLATAIGQPVVGRLVDAYGPRRLFLAGSVLTGVAGVLGTVAPNIGMLIVARVILGFGTCSGYPSAMYLIRSEGERTGRGSPAGILTTLAVSTQTIAVVGPTLGGLLIGLGGWRTTFAVNIPLALACLVLGRIRLPRTGPAKQAPSLDSGGIALFAVMLVSLLLFLMQLRGSLWFLPVLTVAAGVAFALHERRTSEPFIDVRVLAGNVPLLLTYLRTLLAFVVSYAFLYGFTQWLEDARGLSASQTGLVLLPIFGIGILVSLATGRRPEVRGKLIVGAIAQVLACLLLLRLTASSAVWVIIAVAVVVGVPQGLNSLANQNALYHQADPARIASSAGLLRTFSYLGAIVASAASGSFFGRVADTAGLHELAAFMLIAAVLFVAVTVLDRSLWAVGRNPEGST